MPSKPEQTKIATLLRLIDERIATQNKIIEKYKSLIKGIAQHCIKESISGITYVKLGDICKITTGKLDANAQVDNGIFPFSLVQNNHSKLITLLLIQKLY